MPKEDQTVATESISVPFPSIPLVSGDAVVRDSGEREAVVAVTVNVRLGSGQVVSVPLEHRFGGWWPPTQAAR